jgi:hypothetical protein
LVTYAGRIAITLPVLYPCYLHDKGCMQVLRHNMWYYMESSLGSAIAFWLT